MAIDGGLRKLFQSRLKDVHFQSVETWSTGQGVPDVNYCIEGTEGWIEFKFTQAWSWTIRSHQIAWIEKRVRHGGKVLIAVRRTTNYCDELWILNHKSIRKPNLKSMDEELILDLWSGGPVLWNWTLIQNRLKLGG